MDQNSVKVGACSTQQSELGEAAQAKREEVASCEVAALKHSHIPKEKLGAVMIEAGQQ
jgi:hypothetical protein